MAWQHKFKFEEGKVVLTPILKQIFWHRIGFQNSYSRIQKSTFHNSYYGVRKLYFRIIILEKYPILK